MSKTNKGQFLILIVVFPLLALAQKKETNNWCWGIGAGLRFSKAPPMVLPDTRIRSDEAGATISDSLGNLLFYTDGDSLFRPNTSTIYIRKKIGIEKDSFSYNTSSLIIPKPKSRNRYWVFTTPDVNKSPVPRFNYCTIGFQVDMALDGGKGNIDTNSIFRIFRQGESSIASMLHQDGKSQWLINRLYNSDSLFAWLIDSVGINEPILSKIYSPFNPYYGGSSTKANSGLSFRIIKSSPDSRLIFFNWRQKTNRYNQLLRFNRITGHFTDLIHMVDSSQLDSLSMVIPYPVDAAFSPDSRYLYTIENIYQKPLGSISDELNRIIFTIRQYDLSAWDSAAIKNSCKVIFRSQPFYFLGPNGVGPMTCQLGPDGKIYFQEFNQTKLSVMHCPNSPAENVNFKFRQIDLKRKGGFRLPSLNQTFVRNAGNFQLQANKRSMCQGDTLELSAYGAGAEHFTWSVSPALPQGVKVDTLTWQKISTQNIPPGSYTFRCVGTSRCGDVYDKSMVVHIRPRPAKPSPTPAIPPGEHGIILCMYDTIRLSVPDTLAHCYWSTTDTTSTIRIVAWNASGTRWFTLITENQYGCQSPPSDSIAVTMKDVLPTPKPVISSLPPLNTDSGFVALCPGDSVTLSASGAQTYAWSDGNRQTIRYFSGSGSMLLYGYDTSGCAAKAETELRYKTLPNPQPVFLLQTPEDTLLTLQTLQNRNYCVSGLPGSTFSFNVQGGTAVDSSEDCITISWLPIPVSRLLTVTETRKEANCKGSATQVLTYRPNLTIPSLITPNNDGKNDALVVQDLDYYTSHHLQLFDRWGKKVLNTTAYKQDWKGEPGIYFYTLVIEGNEFTGWVSVMK